MNGALLLVVEPSFEPMVAYDVARDGTVVRTAWDEESEMARLLHRPHRLLARQLLPTLHRADGAVPRDLVDGWCAQLDAAPLPPRVAPPPFATLDGTSLVLAWWRGAARVEVRWHESDSPTEWAPIVDPARAIRAQLEALPWRP